MGTPNLIIRRQIFSDKKSSTFTLNGTAATGKEVSEKITELNIQVANLWSVLSCLETVSTLIASTVRFFRRTRSPSLPG
jgi:chromosome segregation ATPase